MTSAAPNLSQLTDRKSPVRWYATGFAAVAFIVVARLLLHLLTANRYGIFRDELYYIACSRHLDWGYVDMPPFIPAATWLLTITVRVFVVRDPSDSRDRGLRSDRSHRVSGVSVWRTPLRDGTLCFGNGGFTGLRD